MRRVPAPATAATPTWPRARGRSALVYCACADGRVWWPQAAPPPGADMWWVTSGGVPCHPWWPSTESPTWNIETNVNTASDPWSDGNWEMEKVSTETFINLISQKKEYIMCRRTGGHDIDLFYFSFQVMNNSFQYCVMNIGARTWIKMNLEWNYAGLVCLQNFILRNMFVQTKLWCRFIWKHTIQI